MGWYLLEKISRKTSWEGWVVRIWSINPIRTKLHQIIFVTKVGVYWWTSCDNLRSCAGITIKIDMKWNRKYWYWSISHTYGTNGCLSCGVEWIYLKQYMIRLFSWLYSCERISKRWIFILEVIPKELTKITELVVTL